MTKTEFIENYGPEPSDYPKWVEKFTADLDELLKERAREAWEAGRKEIRDTRAGKRPYIDFNTWYDTFIKEQ